MEKLIISGYVGRDAEVKEFNGQKYTSFSIAVDKSYKKQDGTKVERTNWYNILKSGEGLAKHVRKGTYLTVMGNPNTKLYRDQAGQYQISLNLNAEDVSFGPGQKTEAAAPESHGYQYHGGAVKEQVSEAVPPTGDDDDPPF